MPISPHSMSWCRWKSPDGPVSIYHPFWGDDELRGGVDYDLIIVGGGLAGSALAIALAPIGARILIVESQDQFRDRIRGEVLMPWGSLEAKRLGIYDLLLESCAIEVAYYSRFRRGAPAAVRDLAATTPANTCCMTFPHPAMQEIL